MVLVTLSSCPNVRFVNVQACTIVGIDCCYFPIIVGLLLLLLVDRQTRGDDMNMTNNTPTDGVIER